MSSNHQSIHFFIIPLSTPVLSSQKDNSIVSVIISLSCLCLIDDSLKNDDFIDKIMNMALWVIFLLQLVPVVQYSTPIRSTVLAMVPYSCKYGTSVSKH